VKKIPLIDAIMYIVSQCIGASLGGIVAVLLVGGSLSFTIGDSMLVAVVEAIGAAVLVLGVASVAFQKTPQAASGLVIGSSLTLGIVIASVGSAGILNPAVALGIGSLSFAYLFGPLVGGVLAALGYQWLQGEKKVG
jgi:glycerol uptake facilitator-like aquaporin